LYPCECVKGSDNGLYIRCENANLATLSVALQNLASFEMPIEELTIYKGHFGSNFKNFLKLISFNVLIPYLVRLYGPLFAHIKARFLIIEETPLATIEDYVFYGVNNTLEQLHLLRTNLSHVGPLGFGVRIILSNQNVFI